jgi:predicted transcriptional regulator
LRLENKPQPFLDIIGKSITQSESQRVRIIEKVLFALDVHGSLKTTDLKDITGLSWNGIIHTLRLLKQKNIIKCRCFPRKNNTKIYSIKRDRSIAYSLHLYRSKYSESWKRISSRYKKQSKDASTDVLKRQFIDTYFPYFIDHIIKDLKAVKARDSHLLKTFPKDLLDKDLHIQVDGTRKRIEIGNLPYYEARKIMNNWFLGRYCLGCLEKGLIYPVILNGDERWCTNCGKNDQPLSLIGSQKDPRLGSRRFEVAKEEKFFRKKIS